MKCSTQQRTPEVWTSDMVAKFHRELRVVTLWSKRDWAAKSKHLYSRVLITLGEVFFVNQDTERGGFWGKNELQPFGMSSKAHSSEPTAAQVNLPQTMPGGMSNHNRNNLKCSSVLGVHRVLSYCCCPSQTSAALPSTASGTRAGRKCKIHKVPARCHQGLVHVVN